MNELFIITGYLLLFATSLVLAHVVSIITHLRKLINADESVLEAVDAALDAHVKKIAALEYQVKKLTENNESQDDVLFTAEEIKESVDVSKLNLNEFNSEDALEDVIHGLPYRNAYEKYMDSQNWNKYDADGMFHTEDITVTMPIKTPKTKKKVKSIPPKPRTVTESEVPKERLPKVEHNIPMPPVKPPHQGAEYINEADGIRRKNPKK